MVEMTFIKFGVPWRMHFELFRRVKYPLLWCSLHSEQYLSGLGCVPKRYAQEKHFAHISSLLLSQVKRNHSRTEYLMVRQKSSVHAP